MIVCHIRADDVQNVFEQQIKDENQTTLELSDRIIASPRKLTVLVTLSM